MAGAPLPVNESDRMDSLRSLDILDTPPEERFDRLTRLARRLFDVPIALLSMVDSDRQWFKSKIGVEQSETPRDQAFCAHVILGDEVMVVPDAKADERFRDVSLTLDGREIRFYAGCPVRAPDGSALGTLCVVAHEPREVAEEDGLLLRDLAEMVEQELKARALATLDELTGLTNRRGFNAVAFHALAMCERSERPATLLLFDLDGFKEVNDTLGHNAGDRVLRRFADDLRATFRDSDVVARMGGDEFCVLLSGADQDETGRPLAILGKRLEDGELGMTIGFSVGVASYDAEAHHSVWDLIEDADTRMYQHKRANRAG